jgi:predicted NBD/HSP70 family sugar kinase
VIGITGRAAALLQAVHAHPGLTRTGAARVLGIGSGAVTELVARLCGAHLLSERPTAPSGTRGRPTTELIPHPDGPLVLAVVIAQESWQVDAVQLGGVTVATVGARHRDNDPATALAAVAEGIRGLREQLPGRVRGVGISVPGTVLEDRLLEAPNLGWRDLDLRAVWSDAELFVADNDATLAAAAESRRGAAVDATVALHLRVEAGLGGAVVADGRVLGGANGVAGEFGHMPFGDPATECPCGARGCWGTAVDGTALAGLLGEPCPPDPVTYGKQVLARAAAGGDAESRAVAEIAACLGRGIAGLVNGLDPDLVTLGGLAADMLTIAPQPLDDAYRAGLMAFRRSTAPPVVPAMLGDAGPLAGAAEEVWTRLWHRL